VGVNKGSYVKMYKDNSPIKVIAYGIKTTVQSKRSPMGCRLRIFLTQEEKATLDELRKATLVPQRTKDRAFVLLLNARGWKNAQIAW